MDKPWQYYLFLATTLLRHAEMRDDNYNISALHEVFEHMEPQSLRDKVIAAYLPQWNAWKANHPIHTVTAEELAEKAQDMFRAETPDKAGVGEDLADMVLRYLGDFGGHE